MFQSKIGTAEYRSYIKKVGRIKYGEKLIWT